MITQLATVAIRASVRVSPATVPPKFVIRSKSRSRLLASESLSLASCAWATSGSRSVRSTRLAQPRRSGGAARQSPHRLGSRTASWGWRCPICFQDLGELGRHDLGGRLGAVERRGVEVQARYSPAAGESRGRAWSPVLAAPPRAGPPAIGFASPTLISTRASEGPNASRILFLTWFGVLVGRADIEPRQRSCPWRRAGSRP